MTDPKRLTEEERRKLLDWPYGLPGPHGFNWPADIPRLVETIRAQARELAEARELIMEIWPYTADRAVARRARRWLAATAQETEGGDDGQ